MADNVEIEQTNITVETNPAETVVEFRYYGINEAALAALTPRVASIEDFMDQLEADLNAALAAGTGPLSTQITALQSLVSADMAALDAEEVARAAADVVLSDMIVEVDDRLTPLVAAEPTARDVAIAAEAVARDLAIAAAIVPVTAAHDILDATVDGLVASFSALDAAQTALAGDVTTLSSDFDALSAEFATWSGDFTDVQNAVTAEISARAAADTALETALDARLDVLEAAILGTLDFDSILTAGGEVLVDDAGNVLTE